MQMVAQAAACSGTVVRVRVAAQGKLRARRGFSAGVEEGNVIENEGGGGEPFYKSSRQLKGLQR